MRIDSAVTADDISLAETVAPAAMLLAGVPLLTMLVMTAVRYIASGTL